MLTRLDRHHGDIELVIGRVLSPRGRGVEARRQGAARGRRSLSRRRQLTTRPLGLARDRRALEHIFDRGHRCSLVFGVAVLAGFLPSIAGVGCDQRYQVADLLGSKGAAFRDRPGWHDFAYTAAADRIADIISREISLGERGRVKQRVQRRPDAALARVAVALAAIAGEDARPALGVDRLLRGEGMLFARLVVHRVGGAAAHQEEDQHHHHCDLFLAIHTPASAPRREVATPAGACHVAGRSCRQG